MKPPALAQGPLPTGPAPSEKRLRLRIQPLRVVVGQDLIQFFQRVAEDAVASLPPTSDGSTATHTTAGGSHSSGAAASPSSTSTSSSSSSSSAMTYFQVLHVASLRLKIDFVPTHVDQTALLHGDYLQLLNLVPIEGMELTLRAVERWGVAGGWPGALAVVVTAWGDHISRTQVHKCLAGVNASLLPIRSVANMGAGAADLVLLPLHHFRKSAGGGGSGGGASAGKRGGGSGGRTGMSITKGVVKGVTSFARAVALEGLRFAAGVAVTTQVQTGERGVCGGRGSCVRGEEGAAGIQRKGARTRAGFEPRGVMCSPCRCTCCSW